MAGDSEVLKALTKLQQEIRYAVSVVEGLLDALSEVDSEFDEYAGAVETEIQEAREREN